MYHKIWCDSKSWKILETKQGLNKAWIACAVVLHGKICYWTTVLCCGSLLWNRNAMIWGDLWSPACPLLILPIPEPEEFHRLFGCSVSWWQPIAPSDDPYSLVG